MNQTPKDSPQANTYKKGDIVWVLYRGKEFYPARVNAYYPKERKISHIWFPLNRKSISAIFKADLSRVRPFTLEDSLPDNASQELEYSYDQAVRILHGTSVEEILEENDRMMEEMGITVQKPKSSTKKSLNTSDGGMRKSGASPKSTPKQYKTPRTAASAYQQQPEVEPPAEVQFIPGDPIIVDTSIGMWPGIFHSYIDEPGPDADDIRYTLFPRDPSSDILAGKKASIVHFPLPHIEQSINEGVGSDMLMEALRDALQYVKVRNATHEAASASKHLGISSQNEHFLKTLPTPSDVKDTPIVSAQSTSSLKTPKSIAKKKPAQKMAPRAKELKEEIISKHDEELSNSRNIDDTTTTTMTPPVAVTPKNKTFITDKRFRLSSTSSVDVSPYQPPPEKKAKSFNNDEHESSLTEEEKQKQLELFPKKETPASRESIGGTSSSSTITTYKQITKKPHNGHHMNSRSPVKINNDLPPTFPNESEPMDFEPHQSKSTSPQKHLIGTNFAGKPSLFDLASSEDAHEHMRQIWVECDETWFKEMLNSEFLQLDFRSGGLLTFKETEKLITEVEKWIKMGNITPMSHFREQFYIAKYVLPELCTYALSKMQDISMMDARRIYEERREKAKHQTGLNSTSPNSLDTLIMAASMKMAEEKNGGLNEGK
uniref:PWWP domain-containing protein n=1 Tax=Meloidogyne incognita TaxID=6306 RepID=A0A914MYV3_MELIC